MKSQLLIPVTLLLLFFAAAPADGRRRVPEAPQAAARLEKIRFNLYADSIKPILNYYVNVEGVYAGGRILPLDGNDVTITADHGTMAGNEWVAPKHIDFDRVTFRVTAKGKPELQETVTVYIQKYKDPRDDIKANDMDMPVVPNKGRR